MKQTLVVLALVCFATAASAAVRDNDEIRHFVEPVETPTWVVDRILGTTTAVDPVPTNEEPSIDFETIVNIAEKVWTVIEKNQPVLNVSYKYANALPKGVSSAETLEGWSGIQYRSYRQYGKNLFGMTVYDVEYTLVHRYGGHYKGRGQYLENVAVVPTKAEALWGYTVNLDVSSISTVNVGSNADPVASLLLEMTLKVSTVIKKGEYRSVFDFRGNNPRVVAVQ